MIFIKKAAVYSIESLAAAFFFNVVKTLIDKGIIRQIRKRVDEPSFPFLLLALIMDKR